MTSLQIQCFLAIVEQHSFTSAAKSLFVTQPAISKQIRQLEQDLGHTLFYRSGKNMILTSAGEAFYEFFSQCRFHIELIQNQLKQQAERNGVTFSLSYLEGLDPSYFVPIIKDQIALVSDSVWLETACYPLSQLLDALDEGRTDAVLVFGSAIAREDYTTHPLVQVPRTVLYSSAKYPQPITDVNQLREETFFLPEDQYTPHLEQTLYHIFLDLGFTPKIAYAPNFTTILDWIHEGKGVFIYNQWFRQFSSDISSLQLNNAQTLYLVRRRRPLHPEVERLIDCIISRFPEGITQ